MRVTSAQPCIRTATGVLSRLWVSAYVWLWFKKALPSKLHNSKNGLPSLSEIMLPNDELPMDPMYIPAMNAHDAKHNGRRALHIFTLMIVAEGGDPQKVISTGCPMWTWVGLIGFRVFHCLTNSDQACWILAEAAGQDCGTLKSKSGQPMSKSKWDAPVGPVRWRTA